MKDAFVARGLLEDHAECHDALDSARQTSISLSIRHLFVIILWHWQTTSPSNMFYEFY